METLIWKVSASSPDPGVIAKAGNLVSSGGLLAFPTETVYGLGANALDANAVQRIFEAKGRPSNNPVIVHLVTRAVLQQVVGDWPSSAELLARYFWPGPLSIVLPKHSDVPPGVTAGAPTVAVRVPDHPVALALLAAANCPVAAPSANLSTAISPTTARHVLQGLEGRIDAVLDGGPCKGGIESTVLTLAESQPRILRPGLIDRATLESVLGVEVVEPGPHRDNTESGSELLEPMLSPGQMEKHYAPTTPLELVDGTGWPRVERLLEAGKAVGWVTFGIAAAQDVEHPRLTVRAMPADVKGYAARLYAALHELDACNLDRIVCAAPPNREAWTAVRDRLQRAAAR